MTHKKKQQPGLFAACDSFVETTVRGATGPMATTFMVWVEFKVRQDLLEVESSFLRQVLLGLQGKTGSVRIFK